MSETEVIDVQSEEQQEQAEAIEWARAALDYVSLEGQDPDDEEVRVLHKYIRLTSMYENEIERAKKQAAAIIRGLENKVKGLEYVYASMAQSVTRRLIGNGKTKNVKTPWGTAGFRSRPASVTISDPETLVEQAQLAPELRCLVRTKVEPSKSAINEYFKTTGAIPPGCEVIPAGETFYVR